MALCIARNSIRGVPIRPPPGSEPRFDGAFARVIAESDGICGMRLPENLQGRPSRIVVIAIPKAEMQQMIPDKCEVALAVRLGSFPLVIHSCGSFQPASS